MSHLLQIYRAHFRTWTAVQLQYRVAMAIWLIGMVLEPVVYLVVWTNVAKASGGAVGGYDVGGFAAYFIASLLVNHLTFTWHMWDYDYVIREGLLSPRLLRPFHPIHADIAENLSYKTITAIVVWPTAVVLIYLFKPTIPPAGWYWFTFVPALLMAFLIQFLLGWAVAMAAFWTTRISAINRMWFLGKLFFAGQIAPLDLLPPALQTVAAISPYRWILAFPVEMALGRLSIEEALWGLCAQAVWLVLAYTAVRLTWQAGIKKYSAFGA